MMEVAYSNTCTGQVITIPGLLSGESLVNKDGRLSERPQKWQTFSRLTNGAGVPYDLSYQQLHLFGQDEQK